MRAPRATDTAQLTLRHRLISSKFDWSNAACQASVTRHWQAPIMCGLEPTFSDRETISCGLGPTFSGPRADFVRPRPI
jgi:hypothetical protein